MTDVQQVGDTADYDTVEFTETLNFLEEWSNDVDSVNLLKSLIGDLNPRVRDWVNRQSVNNLGKVVEPGRQVDRLEQGLVKRLEHLEWYDSSHVRALLNIRLREERQGKHPIFENDYDFGWLDVEISGDAEATHIPHAALTGVREEFVESGAEIVANLQDLREKFVLLVTIHGDQYPVPDIALVGPSERDDFEDAEADLVKTVYLPLRKDIQSGNKRASMRSRLQNLAGLAAGNDNWRRTFEHAYKSETALRENFRRRMKEALTEIMGLLEETTGRVAEDDELEVLREAATIMAYRLMFLLELQRRGMLYTETPDEPSLLELADRPDEESPPRPGQLVRTLQHVTRAFNGDISDPAIALSGASIFNDQPTEAFDDRLEDWLSSLDEFDVSDDECRAEFDEGLLRRWDDALARTGAIVTGQLDDYVQLVAGGATGFGGAEHTHRVLGDVYEQILAMVPGRNEKTGEIELQLAEHVSDNTDERSALGAHYTPPQLVEEVVRPALGHIFRKLWEEVDCNADRFVLRLRELKYVDPAMGSAHFLTVTALEIAREIAYAAQFHRPRPFEWHEALEFPESLPPAQLDEDEIKRIDRATKTLLPEVVANCTHGVDINPLACELGKLAMWLFTLAVRDNSDTAESAPDLTFLDENIKSGDSLVGVTLQQALDTIQGALRKDAQRQTRNLSLFDCPRLSLEERLAPILELQRIVRAPDEVLDEWIDQQWLNYFEKCQVPESSYRRREALSNLATKRLKQIDWFYDLAVLIEYYGNYSKEQARNLYQLITGRKIAANNAKDGLESLLLELTEAVSADKQDLADRLQACIENIKDQACRLNVFHWQLEFPEIVGVDGTGETDAGFDLIVANPPFIGSQKMKGRLGESMQQYLANFYFDGAAPEYSAFFYSRYATILNREGTFSSIAPNTIAQGKVRRAAIVPIFHEERTDCPFKFFRACQNRDWPNEANVHIALVTATRSGLAGTPIRLAYTDWAGDPSGNLFKLKYPERISSYLDELPDYDLHSLDATRTLSTLHYYDDQEPLVITGFNIQSELKRPLGFTERVPADERDCVFAYYNNRTVKKQVVAEANELVIDFTDALRRAGEYNSSIRRQKNWLNANYEFLFSSLRESVTSRSGAWWQLERDRLHLRDAWQELQQIIVFGDVSKCWIPQRIDKVDRGTGLEIRPTIKLYVVPNSSLSLLGLITSPAFEIHTRRVSSSLKSDLSVIPSETLPTFAMPWDSVWSSKQRRPILGVPPSGVASVIEPIMSKILQLRKELLQCPPEYFRHTNASDWGVTKLYNNLDDPDVCGAEIEALREAHRDLHDGVAEVYGWDDVVGCRWDFERPWLDGTTRYVPVKSVRARLLEHVERENEIRRLQEDRLYCREIAKHLPDKGLSTNQVSNLGFVKTLPMPTSGSTEKLAAILESGANQGILEKFDGKWRSAE